MKILVFSDSHGSVFNMQKAVNMHPDAQFILHLGDGIADLNRLRSDVKYSIYCVNGNFEDLSSLSKKSDNSRCIEICGKIIYMCHGHKERVGLGLNNLILSSIENNADIALYGHTHVKFNKYFPIGQLPFEYNKGLYVFNPGSISLPRDDLYSSYGIIDIQGSDILLSHGIINK